MGTCTIDGCEKPTVARGWCSGHYSSWRYRTQLAKPHVALSCSVPGCQERYQGKGFCNRHYQRNLRAEATKIREANGLGRKRNVCAEDGCVSFVKCSGLCAKHYQRAKSRDLIAGLPRCLRYECERPADAHGLCKTHYAALKRRRAGVPERPPSEAGPGRYVSTNGYASIYRPDHPNAGQNGHVPEHRFVMSEHIGRPLYSHETVHHKNGDRADNRLYNLELWSSAQPPGQRVEDKLKWCREFIAAYESKQTT